jgi:tRNA(adenine34) deaminase
MPKDGIALLYLFYNKKQNTLLRHSLFLVRYSILIPLSKKKNSGLSMNYDRFMKKALEQAEDALALGEFPVGCVLVHREEVLVTGARTGTSGDGKNELDHAEMVALRRLIELDTPVNHGNVTIFCTMEPCLMCYAALILAGIGKIVYAYEDVMGGGISCELSRLRPLYQNSAIAVVSDVLRTESLKLFQAYFSNPDSNYWKNSLLAEYTLAQ